MKLAVIGAGGFIGGRIVELCHQEGWAAVRAIARSTSSLKRFSDLDVDCRVADAFDQDSLTAVLEDCDIVLDAVGGGRREILHTVAPIYQAAEKAGVKRLIYLSSASVHGQNPEPGTDENSELNERQSIPYNRYKIKAERILLSLSRKGNVEVVILRPGIVYGPNSRWTREFLSAYDAGKAYLVDGGEGVFNGIHVDNLAYAVHLSMTGRDVDGQAFLLGDRETMTWADFYRAICEKTGRDFTTIRNVAYTKPRLSLTERCLSFLDCEIINICLDHMPEAIRRKVRGTLSEMLKDGKEKELEMALLQTCRYKFPYEKARRMLGYEPRISFEDGISES